jgi:hypothetical protein
MTELCILKYSFFFIIIIRCWLPVKLNVALRAVGRKDLVLIAVHIVAGAVQDCRLAIALLLAAFLAAAGRYCYALLLLRSCCCALFFLATAIAGRCSCAILLLLHCRLRWLLRCAMRGCSAIATAFIAAVSLLLSLPFATAIVLRTLLG